MFKTKVVIIASNIFKCYKTEKSGRITALSVLGYINAQQNVTTMHLLGLLWQKCYDVARVVEQVPAR